jgi:hypothetical protein
MILRIVVNDDRYRVSNLTGTVSAAVPKVDFFGRLSEFRSR